MPKHEMIVGNDGSLRMVYADEVTKAFAADAKIAVRRASHVEPIVVAGPDWRHPGVNTGVRWQADMTPVGGPILGPFKSRQEALDAEHAWLVKHNIPFPKEV